MRSLMMHANGWMAAVCWSTDGLLNSINTADHCWKVCLCCSDAITRPLAHSTSADLRPQLTRRHPQSILADTYLLNACFIASGVQQLHMQSIDAVDDLLPALTTIIVGLFMSDVPTHVTQYYIDILYVMCTEYPDALSRKIVTPNRSLK